MWIGAAANKDCGHSIELRLSEIMTHGFYLAPPTRDGAMALSYYSSPLLPLCVRHASFFVEADASSPVPLVCGADSFLPPDLYQSTPPPGRMMPCLS